MRKYLLLTFCVASSLALFSCKSKKILVDQPPKQEMPAEDAVADMQEDMPGTTVEAVDEGLKVTFDSNIQFELTSSSLTEAAPQKLQRSKELRVGKEGDSM